MEEKEEGKWENKETRERCKIKRRGGRGGRKYWKEGGRRERGQGYKLTGRKEKKNVGGRGRERGRKKEEGSYEDKWTERKRNKEIKKEEEESK